MLFTQSALFVHMGAPSVRESEERRDDGNWIHSKPRSSYTGNSLLKSLVIASLCTLGAQASVRESDDEMRTGSINWQEFPTLEAITISSKAWLWQKFVQWVPKTLLKE
ncbi:hypothetical protein AVEN_22997-1 [Araneus ventricosus]|uniref:Uncharacterized protein n=1 Tax=Araneus ventricosus TaxID=182803 RepID=A0A4Y2XAZ1_ARAVE|nr:hypothetical protein AVEN_22997-1 [Araneus ventricosus]